MRTYDAINKISKRIIDENICEAIILKGSIGRGDDDQYSDVDMYVIIKQDKMEEFLNKRVDYLMEYKKIIYKSYADFVGPQIIAIFEDGLHFDLYTVTRETLSRIDKIKAIYDPNNLFNDYCSEVMEINKFEYISMFNDTLYNFIEADSAFKRKNYPWTAKLLTHSIEWCAILLRYIFDKEHAYLGLNKINYILPREQYLWLEESSANLNEEGFKEANKKIITILDYIVNNVDEDIKNKLNTDFLAWIKNNLNSVLF